MALSGLSTRTVLTAERLTFCRLSEYSSILEHTERKEACVNRAAANAVAVSAGRARSRWELKHREMGKRYYVANYILHVLNTSHPSQGKRWLIIVRFWTTFTFLLLEMAAMHVFWQTICFHSSALWTATESPEKFEKHTLTHWHWDTHTHSAVPVCACTLSKASTRCLTNTRLYSHVPSHNQSSKQRVAYAHPLWDVKSGWITHHWVEDMASTVHKRAASDQSAS